MTVKDLLYLMLDYECYWSRADLINSLPASTRLLQIDFLLGLFDLRKQASQIFENKSPDFFRPRSEQKTSKDSALIVADLNYLTSGKFLMGREGEMQILTEKIKAEVKKLFPSFESEIERRDAGLSIMFNNLYLFRKQAHQFCEPPGKMLIGFSTGLHYSFYLQSKLKELVTKNLDEIDETLCSAMDLRQRRFNKETVGFPEADLDSIDSDWLMDNY